MISWRLFSHKFFDNLRMLLSWSWAIFIKALVFSFSPRANFSLLKYLCFSFLPSFSIHSYLAQKSLNRKIIILSIRSRSFDYTLTQQVSISFDTKNHRYVLFYSIRNYNAKTSEIWTKVMWQKILGEMLTRFFDTVQIYRCLGWKVFQNLINGVWNKNILGGKFSKN